MSDAPDLRIGQLVADSPVGAGRVTGFTQRGCPQVNGVAVSRLTRRGGDLFFFVAATGKLIGKQVKWGALADFGRPLVASAEGGL